MKSKIAWQEGSLAPPAGLHYTNTAALVHWVIVAIRSQNRSLPAIGLWQLELFMVENKIPSVIHPGRDLRFPGVCVV